MAAPATASTGAARAPLAFEAMQRRRLPVLLAEVRVLIRVERQLVEMLDIFQRIEGQFGEIHFGAAERFDLRRGILYPGPGYAVPLGIVRILLHPKLVAQPHPVERALQVDEVHQHRRLLARVGG